MRRNQCIPELCTLWFTTLARKRQAASTFPVLQSNHTCRPTSNFTQTRSTPIATAHADGVPRNDWFSLLKIPCKTQPLRSVRRVWRKRYGTVNAAYRLGFNLQAHTRPLSRFDKDDDRIHGRPRLYQLSSERPATAYRIGEVYLWVPLSCTIKFTSQCLGRVHIV